MTKKDLIFEVTRINPQLHHKITEQAVNILFDTLTQALSQHQRIELRGLGVFMVRHRPAHISHNPQTGQAIQVPEKMTPFFKPSLALREELKKRRTDKSSKKLGFFASIYNDLRGYSS